MVAELLSGGLPLPCERAREEKTTEGTTVEASDLAGLLRNDFETRERERGVLALKHESRILRH